MEVELEEQVRFHTAEVKREICDTLIDEHILGEGNALVRKLSLGPSAVHVRFASENDRLALLNRIVREPTKPAINDLLRLVLISGEGRFATALSPPEKRMRKAWKKKREHAQVVVHCVCFPAPVSGEAWGEFYEQWSLLLLNVQNRPYLQGALERKLPLEVTYATYGEEVIRFSILKPIGANEPGARIRNLDPV